MEETLESNMTDQPSQQSNGKTVNRSTSDITTRTDIGAAEPQCPQTDTKLDQTYLSQIQAEVAKEGFTTPQQIYDTINSLSTEKSSSSNPSAFQRPENQPMLTSSSSTETSLSQMESFLSIPTLPAKGTGRRVELTLQEKVDLIRHSEGKSHRALADIFEIGRSQVSQILKRKHEILDMYAKGGHVERKRLRIHSEKNEINKMTHIWFLEQTKEGVTLTGPCVQAKAKEFALHLGKTDFKASNGWLQSFCKRNNIVFNAKKGLYIMESRLDLSWPSQVVRESDSWTELRNLPGTPGEEEKNNESNKTGPKTQDNHILEGDSSQGSCSVVDESRSSKTTPAKSVGKKFKRCELNLLEKVELLKQSSEGKSEKMLSKMFGIGRSQVYSTLKRKAEILEAYENTDNTKRKRLNNRGDTDEINQLTWHWFKEIAKMDSVVICGPMLQAKAMEFANQLGRADFKASNGWLDTFKKRHHIKFKNEQGFVYDPPENIPLDDIFPSAQEEPVVKAKKMKTVTGSKRVDLNLKQRVEVIQQSEGRSYRQLGAMFGVGRSQIRMILRRKDEILEMYDKSCNSEMKRLNKRTEFDDVNRLTLEWLSEVTADPNAKISGVMVQEKAREIAVRNGREDFKASNGWLCSFRKRNGIVVNDQKYLMISDKKDIETWKMSLPDYTDLNDPADIFCVSEVSLFYTCMPEEVLAAAKHQIQKKTKSRCVSVIICSNMVGEFQIPMVIGKETQDNLRMSIAEDLPVKWRLGTSTHSMGDLFMDWLADFDQRMKEESRKVVLFMHKIPQSDTEILLENVQLVSPPTYSTSFQPLSHGVIQAFKKNYLKLMMSAVIEETMDARSSIGNILNQITMSGVCSWIVQAVGGIQSSLVTRAFSDCGFETGSVTFDNAGTADQIETDDDYDALVQKVLKILVKKPLGFYMGMSVDPSSQTFQNSTCHLEKERVPSIPSATGSLPCETHSSDDDGSDSDNGEDVDDDVKEEPFEPSDEESDDAPETSSPLARSLYRSSRRAKLQQTIPHESSPSSPSSIEQFQIKTEDQSIEGYESPIGSRVLKSREEALEAAQSLRQYCLDNNLNVLENIDSVINSL